MTTRQKQIFATLLLLAAVYFVALGFANEQGAADPHMLSLTSQDEAFQYPFLMRMLTPGETAGETLKHIISYQHYIYGYPFYIASGLTALPLRLAFGEALGSQTRLLLLVLRQVVSVLPMLIAILLLVYLQTRFLSWPRSLSLFALLCLIPGVLRQNIQWWHPDALAIVFVALTFFFLDRDRLRYGRFFYFAAVTAALSAGTKLMGFFFILAVPLYLIMGLRARKLTWQRALRSAVLFVVVMAAVFVLSNPLLLIPETRDRIIATHLSHDSSFTQGWTDDPLYQQGPLSWFPVLNRWYGSPIFLGFLVLSLAAACLRGSETRLNRLVAAWVVPYSLYLFFRIAVRPDHYWLPVMLPLFSSALGLVHLPDRSLRKALRAPYLPAAAALLAGLVIAAQLVLFTVKDARQYTRAINLEKWITACDATPLNQPDEAQTSLPAGRWYALEDYDLDSKPPMRTFRAAEGPISVTAGFRRGTQAWACVDRALAIYRSQESAQDYKLSHPDTVVTGPDGQAIPR